MRLLLIVGVPAALALGILGLPMLVTLFEYGEFSAHDSLMASYSLQAYAIGLPAFLLVKIFAPAFFARQNTKTPVRIGIIALISNMVYNLLFVLPMVWFDVAAPHTALALATSLSAWQQVFMLYRELGRENIYRMPAELTRFALRLLPAFLIMTTALVYLADADWHALELAERGLRLLAVLAASAVGYALLLLISGVRPRHLASS